MLVRVYPLRTQFDGSNVEGATHQHVHHQDGHDDEEESEETLREFAVEVDVHEVCRLAVLLVRVRRPKVVLAEEDVGVVELADHHDEGLHHGVAQGMEWVLGRRTEK